MGLFFHIFPIVAASLYLLASAVYVLSLSYSKGRVASGARWILALGAVMHLVAILYYELSPGIQPNFAFSLSLISCFLVVSFLVLERSWNVSILGAFVAPLASALMFSSAVLFHVGSTEAPILETDFLLSSHILLTILGHVAFVFAFGVSSALILQEFSIRKKCFSDLRRKLPSLRLLDTLNHRLLLGGFFSMAIGVLLGFLFALFNGYGGMELNPRVIWSLVTLVTYATLLMLRASWGVRGRRAAWWSIAGFATVCGSFVSSTLMGGGFHVH